MTRHRVLTSRPTPTKRPPPPDPLDLEWRALWARRGAEMQRRAKAHIERQRAVVRAQDAPRGRDPRAVEARRILVEQAVAGTRTTNEACRLTGLPRATFFRYLNDLREADALQSWHGQPENKP